MHILKSVQEAIIAHAKRVLPAEACGYLASQAGVVVSHFELTNLDASPEHYTMDPKEQFACVREIRKSGLQVAAVYHSHPESPARPSGEDIALAYDPTISYVIVSLATAEPVAKSFKIQNGAVSPEDLIVLE